jgi:hypothetical protein
MLNGNESHQMRKERSTVTRKLSRKAIADRQVLSPSLVCSVRNEVASWATGPLRRGLAESSGG